MRCTMLAIAFAFGLGQVAKAEIIYLACTGTLLQSQTVSFLGIPPSPSMGIERLLPLKIATARPHDHSAGWGQAHAGVNGMTALDGGDADAIAGGLSPSWRITDSQERP
jgi:hypothetical protein